MLKKILLTIVIMGSFFYTRAQYTNVYTTARIEALAGCALVNDLTYSTFNPGKIFAFGDQINMTGYTAGWIAGQFGPLFVNKRLGEHFVLGFNMCTDYSINDVLYTRAAMFSDNSNYLDGFSWLPKINLAMKFGEHVFGIGGYCDYSPYSFLDEKTDGSISDTILGTKIIEEEDCYIVNPGFSLSGYFNLGPVQIEVLGGMSFAKADIEKNITDIDYDSSITTHETDKLENKDGLFYSGGLYAMGDIGNSWWILGGYYDNEEFQLIRAQTKTGVSPTEHSFKNNRYQNISWLSGIVPTLGKNLILGIQYDGYRDKKEELIDRSDSSNLGLTEDSKDTTLIKWSHNVRFIIEKEFNGKRFLDKIIPRGGLKFNLSREHLETYYESHNFSTGTVETGHEEWDKNLNTSKVTLTGGFGIVKGPVQIDIALEILNYSTGVIIGQGVYCMTAILNFGNLGSHN